MVRHNPGALSCSRTTRTRSTVEDNTGEHTAATMVRMQAWCHLMHAGLSEDFEGFAALGGDDEPDIPLPLSMRL